MNYLLDTHTLLWFINGDILLSEKTKKIIQNFDNNCFVSMASIWEISLKISLNKLKLDFDLKELEPFLLENNIELLILNLLIYTG